MLGVQYLFSASLQHWFCAGFLVLLVGEVLESRDLPFLNCCSSLTTSLLGLSLINLSFLYYGFSEELLLVQALLGAAYSATLFFKPWTLKKKKQNCKTNVYIILLALLVVELID